MSKLVLSQNPTPPIRRIKLKKARQTPPRPDLTAFSDRSANHNLPLSLKTAISRYPHCSFFVRPRPEDTSITYRNKSSASVSIVFPSVSCPASKSMMQRRIGGDFYRWHRSDERSSPARGSQSGKKIFVNRLVMTKNGFFNSSINRTGCSKTPPSAALPSAPFSPEHFRNLRQWSSRHVRPESGR